MREEPRKNIIYITLIYIIFLESHMKAQVSSATDLIIYLAAENAKERKILDLFDKYDARVCTTGSELGITIRPTETEIKEMIKVHIDTIKELESLIFGVPCDL
jgi:hypothetical protein